MIFNSLSDKNKLGTAGFTLMEVMIALVILVFISFAIYQAVVESFKIRESLVDEGDFHNGIRLSMNILQRDISMIYSPLLIQPPKTAQNAPAGSAGGPLGSENTQLQQALMQDPTLGDVSQYWGAALDSTGLRPSRFIGTTDKMSFIATSHLRIYQDARESELAKVSYELRDSDREGEKETKALFKTESPNFTVEDDRDSLRHSYPLLYGIKSLEFAYYRKDKERWEKAWDTEKEEFRNIYPDIIRVTFEVLGRSNLSFQGHFEFRPEIPLNGIDAST